MIFFAAIANGYSAKLFSNVVNHNETTTVEPSIGGCFFGSYA
jgi:hypothetical protein